MDPQRTSAGHRAIRARHIEDGPLDQLVENAGSHDRSGSNLKT
jgi:hypothetical protein